MSKIGKDVVGATTRKLKIDKYGYIYIPKDLMKRLSLNPNMEIDVEEFARRLMNLKYEVVKSEDKIVVPVKMTLWGPAIEPGFLQEGGYYLAKVIGFSRIYGLQRVFVQKKKGHYLYADIKVNDILEEGARKDGETVRKFAMVLEKGPDSMTLKPLTEEDVLSYLKAKEVIL